MLILGPDGVPFAPLGVARLAPTREQRLAWAALCALRYIEDADCEEPDERADDDDRHPEDISEGPEWQSGCGCDTCCRRRRMQVALEQMP
jgi:hypothetical protein